MTGLKKKFKNKICKFISKMTKREEEEKRWVHILIKWSHYKVMSAHVLYSRNWNKSGELLGLSSNCFMPPLQCLFNFGNAEPSLTH